MRVAFVYYTTAFLAFSNYVHGARILGLFPHTGKSHQMVFEPLLRKLAEAGHHVTVGSYFPLENPPANYTDISFAGLANVGLGNFDLNWYESFTLTDRIPVVGRMIKQLTDFNVLSAIALNSCSKVINLSSLNEALKKKYDVVLTENFNSDCMLGLLYVHDIRVPIIALSSCVMMPWSADRVGVSDNPSHVPVVSTAFTSRMTFLERMENTFWKIYFKLWFRYRIQIKEKALIEKQFGRQIPDMEDLARNISLLLVNSYYTLNGPTPFAPGLVEVGGMHLHHTKRSIPQVSDIKYLMKGTSAAICGG